MKCALCKHLRAPTTTVREEASAQAEVYLCTNAKCAKVQLVARPRGRNQPNLSLRGKLVSRAQRYSADLKEGRMVWNGHLFVWPASKGGPGGK